MRLVHLKTNLGHHHTALTDALYDILGDNYIFIDLGILTRQRGENKSSVRGVNFHKGRPYIIKINDSKESELKAKELIQEADVLISGGILNQSIYERIKNGKLTFLSTERHLKGPLWKDILRAPLMFAENTKYSSPYLRYLSQSAFFPNDIRLCGNRFKERCYKFAYFTEIPKLNITQIIDSRRKDKIQIVWCARFIDWKHPELPIKMAKRMVDSGRKNFEIRMIGADATPLWHKIRTEIEEKQLQQHVILTGGMPNNDVLECMRQSHIFIFTSDRGEGWGAVLNEAMGAGCACVASNEIGSVPFLLKHKKNGLVFKSCSAESLFQNVAYLYDNPEYCAEYGINAYHTITNEWSAKNAAERLVSLSESILLGNEIMFDDGPCAKAKPIG